jgi:hypothetical protein
MCTRNWLFGVLHVSRHPPGRGSPAWRDLTISALGSAANERHDLGPRAARSARWTSLRACPGPGSGVPSHRRDT